MKIKIISFEAYHGRKNIGSSRLRGHWMAKYMKDGEMYKQGCQSDVIIYQKVFWQEHADAYKGIKILDICDADFLAGQPIKKIMDSMDAITVTTKALKEQLQHFTDVPIHIIPDRLDLEFHKEKKVHKGVAKKVVWFGYFGNSEVLKSTLFALKKHKLKLKVISDGVFAHRPPLKKEDVENVKWDIETVNDEILKADIALLPRLDKGNYKYKSNNKKITAWALGMPVAEEPDELKRFMDPDERRKEARLRWKEVREKYDIKQSVKQLNEIINGIKKHRKKFNKTN